MYTIANSGVSVNPTSIVPMLAKTIMAGEDESRSLAKESNGGSDARSSKPYDDRVRTLHRTNGVGASAGHCLKTKVASHCAASYILTATIPCQSPLRARVIRIRAKSRC